MKVWGAIATDLIRRGGAVLISIRDARGSTPREAGTRMVVFGDGTFTGTIGGGTLEWRAIAEAQRMLAGGASSGARGPALPPSLPSSTRGEEGVSGEVIGPSAPPIALARRRGTTSQHDLSSPLVGEGREGGRGAVQGLYGIPALLTRFHDRSYALGPELGQCCGGHVTLRFEAIAMDAIEDIRRLAAREAAEVFEIMAEIHGDVVARHVIADLPHKPPHPRDVEQYGDHMRTLLLFGAGHVGRALVLALNALPFRVIWIDGRPDAFPGAVPANVTLVRPADPIAVLADASTDGFVLIMTHSHELDLALCDAALRSGKFPYVGVIGSATKRARFERRLIAAGIPRPAVDRLVCPIGAPGPKSKLPAVIAAVTAVELLVADENCLRVRDGASTDKVLDAAAFEAAAFGSAGWGQSRGS